jgi:hypothetical protein
MTGEDYITRTFMLCTPHQILVGSTHQEDLDGGTCSMYAGEVHTGF